MGKLLSLIIVLAVLAPESAWSWGLGSLSSQEEEEQVEVSEPQHPGSEDSDREPARIFTEAEVREMARTRGYAGGIDEDDLEIMPQLSEPTRGRTLQQIRNTVMEE